MVFIFRNLFLFPFLSGFDFPYLFKETISEFPLFPPIWASTLGIGLGGEVLYYGLSSFIYFIISLFVNTLGLPWELVYKIFVFGLFIVLSVISSSHLLKKILDKPSSLQILLGVLIFTSNTYILMILDGGQIGVALAYSLAPLVIARFISIIQNSEFKIQNSIMAGLILAAQVMFDFRLALLTMTIFIFFSIFYYFFIRRFELKLYLICLSSAVLVVLGVHAYWFLPIAVSRSNPAEEFLNTYSSIEGFRFFSFATYSQSLSLLHPNWPENIFGKVYFMKPEFLVFPLIAYMSLLFVKIKSNKTFILSNLTIFFFAFLGLFGAFLAKGANPPIPEINEWLFIRIPFTALFRDSTKFYLLIVISYLILIPYCLNNVGLWLSGKLQLKNKRYLSNILLLVAVFYFLFLIRPVLLNQLNGIFKRHEIPKEYIDFKNFLYSKTSFSRTLWIPTQQRFNYYSYEHPAVAAQQLFPAKNYAEIIGKLTNNRGLLSNLSIRYIIVPYDSFGEIFVKDRKYDDEQYEDVVRQLDSVAWLERIPGFGKVAVYENKEARDHFWIVDAGSISYKQVGISEYEVKVLIDEPTRLVFTDSFNYYWRADTSSENLTSIKTEDNLNSFLLQKKGEYLLKVHFSKKQYYEYGRLITLFFVLLLLFMLVYKKKNR